MQRCRLMVWLDAVSYLGMKTPGSHASFFFFFLSPWVYLFPLRIEKALVDSTVYISNSRLLLALYEKIKEKSLSESVSGSFIDIQLGPFWPFHIMLLFRGQLEFLAWRTIVHVKSIILFVNITWVPRVWYLFHHIYCDKKNTKSTWHHFENVLISMWAFLKRFVTAAILSYCRKSF